MGRKCKDYSEYINKQFGELTILSISEPIKELKSQRICKCKCSCGKEIEIKLNNILNGTTKSCGHLRTNAYSECVGKQFGELTILSISEPRKDLNSHRFCKCKCSCGKEIETLFKHVLAGLKKSCGHLHTKDYSDYIGKQFGELTILSISEPHENKSSLRYCKCKCSCGKETTALFQGVLNGNTKSCGHLYKKDYSDYIGKQFGELTILSISEPIKEKNSARLCKCKCSCGKETQSYLYGVLCGSTKSCGHVHKERSPEVLKKHMQSLHKRKEANTSNKSTGIKNISFDEYGHSYVVQITRNKVRHVKRTSSLAKAIKLKEQILKELGELD